MDEMYMDLKQSVTMENHWRYVSEHFENTFVNNQLNYKCDVNDRLVSVLGLDQ